MQGDWPLTLGVALALLALGALLGELWARLRTPRMPHQSTGARPHYLLGLNFLVSHQPDQAIRELSQAVRHETDALEAYLALGNLLRESGQTERAIDVHRSLLHRPNQSRWEHTQVLFSLAMDFKRAGLIDRAASTFQEVVEAESENLAALTALQQIAEESGRWEEALRFHQRIQTVSRGAEPDLRPALQTEWGMAVGADDPAAAAHFQAALDLRPEYAPARIGLATCLLQQGNAEAARDHLEQAIHAGPPWALAALAVLRRVCRVSGDEAALGPACDAILERDPRAWRAWLELARLRTGRREFVGAREALRAALAERPGSLAVQGQLWELLRLEGEGIEQFVGLLDEALDDARLLDPYVCFRCRFKSAELFARCPHCHAWETMGGERQD
ncbi:MAG TPA: tetratricopeptide repeat protein [Acidobacteriota bacterium]|nr:tetratricopeptide repeat protein [Acidobacteriota bacterium]